MHGCVTMIYVCRDIHVHVGSIPMEVIDLSLTTNLVGQSYNGLKGAQLEQRPL